MLGYPGSQKRTTYSGFNLGRLYSDFPQSAGNDSWFIVSISLERMKWNKMGAAGFSGWCTTI